MLTNRANPNPVQPRTLPPSPMNPQPPSPGEILLPYLNHLLSTRSYPKTICPSECARALSAEELKASGTSSWRDLMPHVREMLWDMRQRGEVEILQKGVPIADEIGLQDIKGPIRARRAQR